MGNRIRPKLTSIEQNRPISETSDSLFLQLLGRSLLLALKERGMLKEGQYRYAQEALNQRCL